MLSQAKLEKYEERKHKCYKLVKKKQDNKLKEDNIPRSMDKLTIKCSEDFGRYGVASKDIRAGEVILVDTPTAGCLGY